VRTARVLPAVAASGLRLLLSLMLGLLLSLVLMPWRAVAAEPAALVSVTINSMEPAVPNRVAEWARAFLAELDAAAEKPDNPAPEPSST